MHIYGMLGHAPKVTPTHICTVRCKLAQRVRVGWWAGRIRMGKVCESRPWDPGRTSRNRLGSGRDHVTWWTSDKCRAKKRHNENNSIKSDLKKNKIKSNVANVRVMVLTITSARLLPSTRSWRKKNDREKKDNSWGKNAAISEPRLCLGAATPSN